MNQSQLKTNTSKWHQARENACAQVTIGFNSDWSRDWREFFNQSQSLVNQNLSKCEITFNTRLKPALRPVKNRLT